MKTLSLRANAKINLSLDITGRRADGYHLMDMVMQSVNLYDRIELTVGADNEGVLVETGLRFLPGDERNTAYKAALRLSEAKGFDLSGIKIGIKKNIPTRAGMGGGSADAAAVLVGLNRLLGLGMSREELAAVGEKVGADVPFCVIGGTARVKGIGEEIAPIAPLKKGRFVILMPRVGNSTPELFSLIDGAPEGALIHPDVDACQRAVEQQDMASLAASFGNLFQQVGDTAETEHLKSLLIQKGALGACLTGSGAAVFGLFPDFRAANRCRDALRGEVFRAYVAAPCEKGVEIL